jgi:putative transcriptional regulator
MKKRVTSIAKPKKRVDRLRKGVDDRPLTASELQRMKPVALSKTIRWKLGLSQKDFAERYGFAPGTVRDWEQYRSEPDAGTRAYLEIIAADPEAVCRLRGRVRKAKAA